MASEDRGDEQTVRGDSPVVGAALVALTVMGFALRVPGVTRLGMFRDDAWVALASHVGPRTSLRMSVTTPGFTLAEWVWLRIGPAATWWAQMPLLIIGVLAIPAMFATARWHRLSSPMALVTAAVVACGPVAVAYSVRIKQYGLEALLACLLLSVAEIARRNEQRRWWALLALGSVVALFFSAAVAPIVVGAWVTQLPSAWRAGKREVLAWGAAAAAGCAVVAAIFFRHLPPLLGTFWKVNGYYIDLSSRARASHTLSLAINRFINGLLPFTLSRGWSLAVLAVLIGLAAVAGRRAVASIVAIGVLAVGSAAGVMPVGTGRTDEVLYPAVLLVAGIGASSLADRLAPLLGARLDGRLPTVHLRTRVAPWLSIGIFIALLLCATATPTVYPGTDMPALDRLYRQNHRAGDLLIVDARNRYLWALDHQRSSNVEFGNGFLTGFTVASSRPDVFLEPAYSVEYGYRPREWAAMARGHTQVEIMGAPFPGVPTSDPVYAALVADGWQPGRPQWARNGYIVVFKPASPHA